MATATGNHSDLLTIEPEERIQDESPALMTTEEMLALPDDEIDRELILGRLLEYPMTTRNVPHSYVTGQLAFFLNLWNREQAGPRGLILVGEARVRVRREPDTTVGIDIAYLAPALASRTPKDAKFVEGSPTLAVEVLSPSDTHGRTTRKIRSYLDAGVSLVWIVDPVFETIVGYRPDAPPRLFHNAETIDAEPHLPGFRVAVSELF